MTDVVATHRTPEQCRVAEHTLEALGLELADCRDALRSYRELAMCAIAALETSTRERDRLQATNARLRELLRKAHARDGATEAA